MPRERSRRRPYPDANLFAPDERGPFPRLPPRPDPTRPLEVDVGCGRGLFLLARAQARPDLDFLGIDRALPRLRKLDAKLVAQGIANVRLLHAEALHAIQTQFEPGTVAAFFILFSDPWPKRRHHPRRLFSPALLEAVHRALRPLGGLHVATDHADYFALIGRLFAADRRFARQPETEPPPAPTDFELLFRSQGHTIHRAYYCKQPVGTQAFRK